MATEVKKKKRKREPAKWIDDYYLQSYQLAKEGASNAGIAKALGVSPSTFQGWREDRPALRRMLKEARNGDTNPKGSVQKFSDYIYEKLPENLRKLYDEIQSFEDATNSVEKVEALLSGAGERARQHLFIHALVTSSFNISQACAAVNISIKQFRKWCHTDPDFHDLIVEMDWHKGNFFESALIKLVQRGDPGAVIFANKTYNKQRGYAEKVEVDVNVAGTVNHQHLHVIAVDDLKLPLETRKLLLEAVREKKEAQRVIDAAKEEAQG